jgi:ferredoxin
LELAVRKRLRLDPIRCDAHGVCAELFPEGIRLDDWGYPMLRSGPIPEDLLEHARRAVFACPALALKLVDDR